MSQKPKPKSFGLREASPLTAEIVSAQRARWTPSAESRAMMTFTGQVLVNVFDALAPQNIVNIGPVRDICMDYLVDQHLGDGEGKLYVDLACGFSSRGVTLAKQLPKLQVIEVDLPNIISQKKSRYRRARVDLPPNHEFIVANVQNNDLIDILDGRKADVVMSRGLMIYFTREAIRAAAQNIVSALKPDGRLIVDVVYGDDETLGSFQRVIDFFRKQTTSDASVGRFPDKESVKTLFQESGYDQVEVNLFSDLEALVKLPEPYLDQMFVVSGQVKQPTDSAQTETSADDTIAATDADDEVKTEPASENSEADNPTQASRPNPDQT